MSQRFKANNDSPNYWFRLGKMRKKASQFPHATVNKGKQLETDQNLKYEARWEIGTRKRKQSHQGSCREAPCLSGFYAKSPSGPGASSTGSTRAQ